MKLPFSYKTDLFGAVLMISVVGHASYFGAEHFIVPSAHYSVVQAESSMEVIMLEPEKPLEEKIEEENVLAVSDEQVTIEAKAKPVLEEIKEETKEEEPSVLPEGGAVIEAVPQYVKNPAPEYPRLARREGWEGLVILDVRVSKEGRADDVRIESSSGYGILDEAARKTVRRWIFEPARLGRLTLASRIRIPVRFVLTQSEKNPS